MYYLLIPLALLVIYLTAGFCIFQIAFRHRRDPDWNDPQVLEKTSWQEFAPIIADSIAWLNSQRAQDVCIQSFDGLTLCGKWIPRENARGTIILFHGYRSNYLTDFGRIMPIYHDFGFNLLLVRQRAHDGSQGKYITFGVHERRDALRWIDYHNRTWGNIPLFLGGMSMGASTVLFTAGEQLPDNVRGATADCGFTSPWEIIGKVMRDRTRLNLNFMLPAINFWCRTLAGFDMTSCHTTKTLSHARIPVFMLHGEADDFVPCDMSRAGFAACSSEKQLLTVKDAGHGTSYLFEPERVRTELLAFFEKHLQ